MPEVIGSFLVLGLLGLGINGLSSHLGCAYSYTVPGRKDISSVT